MLSMIFKRTRRRKTRVFLLLVSVQLVYFVTFRYVIGDHHVVKNEQITNEDVLHSTQFVSAGEQVEAPKKRYLFYDAGSVYHENNYTCPVEWEWSLDMKGADAVWFNVLDHGGALANGIDYLHLGELSGARVFMSLESEVYYPYMLTAKSQGFFEYMVDYRIWDTPANTSPNSSVADIPAVYLGNPTIQDTAIDFRKPPSLPKRTDAYIASFISNCFSKNDRSAYLEELMTYMPVHSYGACHHTIDEPEALVANESISKFDRKMLLGKGYFFWFTAENSNAYSYVTEKIYQAFDAGVVPVYFGAPNIERFVPDPSAIIVADRYSPKELAELLNRTANNPDEYASFFAWKTKPYSQDFMRVMGLASRTVQCRLAMHLQGLDMELD